MTIQWMLIASFLYFELGLITMLILPFISSKIWRSIFQCHFYEVVSKKANMYFNVLIFVLILFFLDSIRDMRKYNSKANHVEFDSELQINVKLFRSQRNYFISGMAVFLWLVIRRLVILIFGEAQLIDSSEEATKQSQTATLHLEKLRKSMKEAKSTKDTVDTKDVEEIKKFKEELDRKKHDVVLLNHRITNFKEKAQQLQQECEDLLKKNNTLKSQVSISYS